MGDLYPKFDILAAMALTSEHFSNLFSGSSLGEVGAGSITADFPRWTNPRQYPCQGGRGKTSLIMLIRRQYLGGVQDAEDALVRYQTEQQRYVALEMGSTTAQASTALAIKQYQAGLSMYTSVLQAQSTQLTAEDNLAQSRAALTADLVSLYKALGGGWKDDGSAPSSPREAHSVDQ